MAAPSLKDNTADVDRLIKGIRRGHPHKQVAVDLSLTKRLPHILREAGYRVEAVLFEDRDIWHLIDIRPLHQDRSIYGLAADIGTSTVVLRLLNLSRRKTIAETSFQNPQCTIGEDILTRILFASSEGGLERLRSLLLFRMKKSFGWPKRAG